MTRYTCDRCEAEIHRPGRSEMREVWIGWPDKEDPFFKQQVVLSFGVTIRPYDPETPDLCDDCYAHILHEVASMLDAEQSEAQS